MGAECPNGHGRQPVIQNITADQSIPRKPTDVIAHKLGCGCIVGGEEYKQFQEAVNTVRAEQAAAINASNKAAADKTAAAYKAYFTSGGADNAK